MSEWTVEDVRALFEERIPEGQRLDYKEKLPLANAADRAEVAKDFSGLANAQGGFLIYGVEEDDSEEPLPKDFRPLAPQGQQTRVEDIVDAAVVPKLDYECRTLEIEGGTLLLAHVAPRTGGPHMVQSYKQNRYYVRRGTRTVPMTEAEVREAYALAEQRTDQVFARVSRLPLVARITRSREIDEAKAALLGHSPKRLPISSVVTAPIDAPPELFMPDFLSPRVFPEPTDRYVDRRDSIAPPEVFSLDATGLVAEAPLGDDSERLVLQRIAIYRLGVCEWAQRYRIPDVMLIPSKAFARDVHNVLLYFSSMYAQAGYYGRLYIWVRIDNAEEVRLGVDPPTVGGVLDIPAGYEFVQAERETSVDELLMDPLPVVRDFMTRVWQYFGYRDCALFDEDGRWA